MPPAPIPKTQPRQPGPRGQDTAANNSRFLQEVFTQTNKFRAMHGCPALKLNKDLSKLAQEWAENLRDRNAMEHRPNPVYGENIFLSGGMDVTGDLPVEMWYREINSYDFAKAQFSPTSGHFTQLIWKSSKEMGTGVARQADRTWVVCNYNPPGNIVGHFKDNVPRKQNSTPSTDPPTERSPQTSVYSRILRDVYIATNKYRAMHGCPPLKINKTLNRIAQEWAKNLRDRNVIEHRPDPIYGENIFLASGLDVDGKLPVDMWYREMDSYDFGKPQYSQISGHFTQLIWKKCKEMGTGFAKRGERTWVVCNYDPPGNVHGEFKENVPRKLKM